MTDTVAIRNAVPADLPRIVALLNVAIVDRRVELPPLYRGLGFVDNGTAPFDDPLLTKPCHFILISKEVTS